MLAAIAARHGMTLGDWETLSVLRRSGRPYRQTPTELAQLLQVTSGTISVRLDRLQASGLIRQVAGAVDGRSKPVQLTADGERRWRDATAERTGVEAKLLSDALTPVELKRFNELLSKVMVALEARFGQPPRRVATGESGADRRRL
jgi:DNA-binding MarR family transcriptional regulator